MIQARRQASTFGIAGVAFMATATLSDAQQAPAPGALRAPVACIVEPSVAAGAMRRSGSALERMITFRAVDVTLPDALDRLSAVAGIRLSYSRELLPTGRAPCIVAADVTVADALSHMLRGSELEPVEAGRDHVVLRRRAAGARESSQSPRADSAPRVQRLTPVVINETALSEPLWTAGSVTTVEHDALARRHARSLGEILEASAPGIWVWDQPPSAFLTQYGSLRGASSFGASSPKVYIDGVEVANPLLVTMLDPEHVARIELIRGPQGAALYGVDALSGVVNITTRRDGAMDGGFDVHVRSSGGVVESRYATSPLMEQSHSVTLRAGSGTRSFAVAIAGDESGSWLPGASARQVNTLVTAQRTGTHAVLGLTARLATATATSPSEPTLSAATLAAETAAGSVVRSALRQYTLGFTARGMPAGPWRYSLVTGIDGYRLADGGGTSNAQPSGLTASTIPAGADRLSLRAGGIYRMNDHDDALVTLTFGAEHAALRQTRATSSWTNAGAVSMQTAGTDSPGSDVPASGTVSGYGSAPSGTGPAASASAPADDWRSNSGVSTQLDIALYRHLFLTGGMRMERLASGGSAPRIAALPMVGAGIVASRDDLTLTLRGAYGRGIRAPRTDQLEIVGQHGSRMGLHRVSLLPEEQEGTETSIRIAKGKLFSMQLTRFDQLASGLVLPVSYSAWDGRRAARLQNVGEIENRGWEIEQSLEGRGLSLSSTLSVIESRVRAVASGYEGELRAGDRMLDVPAMTASVNVGYALTRSSITVGLTHARDWMGYDMVALQADGAATGAALRNYWREYAGVTGLRGSVSRDLTRSLRLVLAGDNLLDVQRGAPDNATLLPGRTTTLSLRALF